MKKLVTIVLVLLLLLVMVPTTPVLAASKVVERRVSSGVNDCLYVRAGNNAQFGYKSDFLSAGNHDATAYKYGSGMRFTNITISRGDEVESAYLYVTAQYDRSVKTVDSRISAEDVDDASSFSGNTADSFDERYDDNTSEVDWDDVGAWKKDTRYKSPNIKDVIQEIVDRSGWKSGNDIVIFWEDFDGESSSGANRVGYSYESGGSSRAAELYIKYTSNGDYDEDDYDYNYEDETEELETQISTLNTRMAELGGMIVLFRGYVTDLSKESELLREGYVSLSNRFETEISALRLEVTSLKTNLESITEIVGGLETDVSASGRFAQLEKRFVEVESELSRKLTLLIWLVASPLILLIAVAGYSIYRRQR